MEPDFHRGSIQHHTADHGVSAEDAFPPGDLHVRIPPSIITFSQRPTEGSRITSWQGDAVQLTRRLCGEFSRELPGSHLCPWIQF